MPQNYTVSGTITTDGSTALRACVVSAYNVTTQGWLTQANNSRSNSSGQYTIDLGNFPNGFSDGDMVILVYLKPDKFYIYETVIDSSAGSESKDVTINAVTYTTPAKVAGLLQVDGFKINGKPALHDVMDAIFEAEGMIDEATNHAWRSRTVTNEYHNIKHFYHRVDGVPIHLNHYAIRTLSASSGDKIEVFDGSSWVDWVATKTENRATGDFWVEYTLGKIFLRNHNAYDEDSQVRVTYRYGDSTVPADIQRATTLLACIKIAEGDDRSVLLPEGTTNISLGDKVDKWRTEANEIINRRKGISAIFR